MDDTKKTLVEWERERGFIAIDDTNPNTKLTEKEFEEIVLDGKRSIVVDYKFREKWLTDNGYDITRANLANADLPSKAQQEAEAGITDSDEQ